MDFDAESFLKGLAVGRVLWNPATYGSIYSAAARGIPQETETEQTEDTEDE